MILTISDNSDKLLVINCCTNSPSDHARTGCRNVPLPIRQLVPQRNAAEKTRSCEDGDGGITNSDMR